MKLQSPILFNRRTRHKRWQSLPTPSGSWTPPHEWDESAWTGQPYWGEGTIELLDDPYIQLMHNRSWVKICVDYNARAISRQTLRLYSNRGLGRGKSRKLDKETLRRLHETPGLEPWLRKARTDPEEVLEHPFLNLMKEVSSVYNTADLWQLTETYMGLTGNCYWYIVKGGNIREPAEMWFLESHKTKPVPGSTMKRAIIGYAYRTEEGEVKPVKPEEVVHHKYPNPLNPIIGLSPMPGLSDAIMVNANIYKYERAQFRNMARPDISVEVPETMTDDEYNRFKEQWRQEFQGTQKAGRFVILEGGAKANPITMSARDLAHLEGRKVTREEIAAGYGVPLPLLTPDRSNRAVSSTAYAQYMRDTIDPKLKQYEQRINEQLLPMFADADDFFVAFDDAVPEDMEYALKERRMNLETGYAAINELRAADGEEPVEWGDRPILPSTMAPLAEETEEEEETPPGAVPPQLEEEEEEEMDEGKPPLEPEKLIDLIADYVLKELEEG